MLANICRLFRRIPRKIIPYHDTSCDAIASTIIESIVPILPSLVYSTAAFRGLIVSEIDNDGNGGEFAVWQTALQKRNPVFWKNRVSNSHNFSFVVAALAGGPAKAVTTN
jgi:hypothetical protein